MSIQIGERTLVTTQPAYLDAKLVQATGCNAAEHAAMLSKHATPVGIANALAPFLSDDAPARAAIAADLAALAPEDLVAVRGEVLALLTAAPTPGAAPSVVA